MIFVVSENLQAAHTALSDVHRDPRDHNAFSMWHGLFLAFLIAGFANESDAKDLPRDSRGAPPSFLGL